MTWKLVTPFVVCVLAWVFFKQTASSKNSVVVQALQYLSRPHDFWTTSHSNAIHEIITTDSAWNGTYMAQHPDIWTEYLSSDDISSLHEAMQHFQRLNISVDAMTINDFPLSENLKDKITKWKYQLGPNGRGFQLIKGVPVRDWTMGQCEIFFWAFGKYLGIPGAQDMEGSLLGHVTDVGETNKVERPYRKRVDIAYHCDGADIVGLLCVHPAKSGGQSRIISAVSVYNTLLTHPKGQSYINRLFGRVLLFTRKSFGLSSYLPVNPLRMDSVGVLRTYWNQDYFVKSYRDVEGGVKPPGESDSFALEAIEAYDAILARDIRRRLAASGRGGGAEEGDGDGVELGLDMSLQQGDVQLVSNHFVMHARTEFEDYSSDELRELLRESNGEGGSTVPAFGKRDLLRLWVSESTEHMSWELYFSKKIDLCRVIGGLVEGLIWYR